MEFFFQIDVFRDTELIAVRSHRASRGGFEASELVANVEERRWSDGDSQNAF